MDDDTARASLTPNQRQMFEHLQAWRAQGGTLKAYAGAHGLSVSALYTAKHTLTQRGLWSKGAAKAKACAAPMFLPVRVRPGSGGAGAVALRVLLPEGIAIELGANGDVSQCVALVQALEARRR